MEDDKILNNFFNSLKPKGFTDIGEKYHEDNWNKMHQNSSSMDSEIQGSVNVKNSDALNKEAKAGLFQKRKEGVSKGMEYLDLASDVATTGMQFVDNFKGGQFNTDPRSGEAPGNGLAEGFQSGMQGAKLGMELGGFTGAGIGLALGVGSTIVGHGKARRKYRENDKKMNIEDDKNLLNKRDEEFRMSEGIASAEGIKAVQQRSLGLIPK